MERRTSFIALTILVSFVRTVQTADGIYTCGLLSAHSPEFDPVNVALNNTFALSNVSIMLKTFNISENINIFNPASLFLQQNVLALIEGTRPKTSACALSTVTGIPLIRLYGNSRPFDQCEKAVQMSAGYRDYAHASLDILNTFRWEKIALVFDETRLHEAGCFHAISQNSQFTVNLVQLAKQGINEDLTVPILKAMGHINILQPEVILLYTSKESMELMLQQKPCRCNKGGKWILQGQVPLKLSSHPNNVVLAMKLPYNEDMAPAEVKNIAETHFNNTSKDLVALAYDAVQVINQALSTQPCSSINGTSITSEGNNAVSSCIRKVNLDGLTGPVQFNEYGNRKGINLEILNLQNNSLIKIGTWNSTKGTTMSEDILRNMETSSHAGTLEGRKLRVVVIETDPFVATKKDNGTISYEGYCIDLLNEMARILKFTYEIYPSPDGMYGGQRDNGTWNGMIGELLNEHADIIVAPLTVTEAREKVVDFTVPYMFYTEDILLKKSSSKDNSDLLQFMNPFHNYVWFCTLATLVIISIAVFVINYFSPYGYKDENGRGTSDEFSFFNSVWFALACMLQQGGDNTPKSLSGRILAGFYWFCILIWVSTYTANLAAFFTVKNSEHPINNLEDLAKSSYQVGVLDSSSVYEAFKTSPLERQQKIWHRMQTAGTFLRDLDQSVQWVRERDNAAFIHDGPTLRHVARQPPCDLTTVPGLSTAKGLAFALQANDPHTIEFTLIILRLHENNFLDGIRRKWWEIANDCPEENESALSRKRIGLSSMLGVYIVLGVGMVIALMVLIGEIFWNKRGRLNLPSKIRRPKISVVEVNSGKNNGNITVFQNVHFKEVLET